MSGLGLLALALLSPIDVYADLLFSVHMVQHLLITMVAAPLLLLGAPATLALRATSAGTRRGLLLPVLHSGFARAVSNPVVAWILFAGVMWATHFSPIYELSLQNTGIHALEHGAYLSTALLFWSPVLAADPSPARISHPARLLYVFLAMPQMAFLGLSIYTSGRVLYPHYILTSARLGLSALEDQHLAGAMMWSSSLLMLPALAYVLLDWFQREQRQAEREEQRVVGSS
jgi:putative membrane protein